MIIKSKWWQTGIVMLGFACFTAEAVADDAMRVIGNRVNLRARPDANAEVVGQLNRGDLVTVKSKTDAWVEIMPPADLNFWIHRDFLDGDEVAAPRLNVRAGPGINYSVVATIERGTRVARRGEFAEWISIDPPGGSSIWITADMVEVIRPEPVARPVVKAPSADPVPPARPPITEVTSASTELTPVTPVVERPPAEPPRDLDLIPLAGQGEQVDREGILRPAGFVFGRPSRYRLTRARGHVIETICYVKGNETQLQSLVGHQLVISGREYWVQGARYPVLVPEQIVLQPGGAH